MRVYRAVRGWWNAGLVAAMVGGVPAAAYGQPSATAGTLYDKVFAGPRLQSTAEAWLNADIPGDFSVGSTNSCPFDPLNWSRANCGSRIVTDGEIVMSTSTSAATARYNRGVLEPWPFNACISVLATPLGTECSSGAIAQTDFGANRVYAQVRGGFTATVPVDNGDPSMGDYTYFVGTDAVATSEWVSEFTPTFSGWLSLQFNVERHGAGRIGEAGSAQLQIGVFATPDNLLAPPLRSGPQDYDPQWEFYGNNPIEGGSNPNLWGWASPYAETFDSFGFGVTPITGGFFVEAGRTYSLVSQLTAFATGNQFIDFWGTARFDAFEVPDGIDPTTAFSYNSASFAVRTAGTDPSTVVPEPATAALVAAGLAGMLAAHRRRRNPWSVTG